MALQFGGFDRIEPLDGLTLAQIYDFRLIEEISMLDHLNGGRMAIRAGRETRKDIDTERERFDDQNKNLDPTRLGGGALAGSPESVRRYIDEYIATGANDFVCSFQWGDLSHETAMCSIELFTRKFMPRYGENPSATAAADAWNTA